MAAMTTDSYSISRPTGVCAHSERAFEVGEEFVATLCELEAQEGYERQDYSIEAWDQGVRPARLLGFWRATQPDANEKPKPFIDDAALQDMFERLEGVEEATRLSFRFLLGLVLMRKRLIREVGRESASGQRVLLVRARGSDSEREPLRLVDPGMDEEALAGATEQFGAIMRGDS
ncbi:MAG: hypothetical protein ACYTF7_06750 [Planctomycetota bacterium]|jgi:hypothetical protein